MTSPTVPEVRQCLDAEDAQFGAVAVKAGENRWGVMNPNNGGHWATDEEVKGWSQPVHTIRQENIQ